MKIRTKYAVACGFALTMFLATQQTVKADTTTDNQATETVANVNQNQTAVSQATSVADSNNAADQATASQNVTNNAATNATQQTVTTDTTQQDVNANANASSQAPASTQANANTNNIEQIKGVVVSHNGSMTFLYTQDGKQITNRGLAPNTPWYTDQKLSLNGSSYYRVATNEFANSSDVTMQYGAAASGEVRVKQSGAVNYTRTEQGFVRSGQPNFKANSVWKFNKTDNLNGLTYYQIANNVWLNSDDATTAPAYQNPSGWLQIQNKQIQPSGGAVGYDLYNGVEGIKTYLVRKYFGYSNAHTIYDGSVAASVRSLQARKGLPVTGVVDLKTWEAMGFVESTWYGIDSYIAPLQTNISSTRSDHIEAMINQARKYLGQPWISGASSSPNYGVDCSGLVTQSLYAAGIDTAPVTSIQHAQPGNEWNSRDYWADSRLHQVSYNSRQRGDLIFFADPSTGVVWHVGILLDPNTMIESWPYAVQIHSIYGNRGTIVGVKRVFA